MMYKLIMQILEKSKTENVDVGVAYDMLAVDGDREQLREAHTILQDNYKAITALRNAGHNTEIAIICDMYQRGEKSRVKDYIQQLVDEGIIEE